MQHSLHLTKEDKEIHVFDGMFETAVRTHIYSFIRNSHFAITGGVVTDIEKQHEHTMSCFLGEQDLRHLEFFQNADDKFLEMAAPQKCSRAFILLQNEKFFSRWHTDGLRYKWTMLYYANLNWDKDWGGETMFSNETYDTIDLAVQYKPGRVVLFDSSIPHKACLGSPDSPQFRTLLSFNFDE